MLLLLLLMLPLLFTRFLYSKKQFGLPASGLWPAPSLTAFVGCLSAGRPAPSERIFPFTTHPYQKQAISCCCRCCTAVLTPRWLGTSILERKRRQEEHQSIWKYIFPDAQSQLEPPTTNLTCLMVCTGCYNRTLATITLMDTESSGRGNTSLFFGT